MVPPLPHCGRGCRAAARRVRAPQSRQFASRRSSPIWRHCRSRWCSLSFSSCRSHLVVVVSFFGYETYQILIPAFTLDNYREVFSESVTYRTYLITVKFCVIVWAITVCTRLLHRLFPRLPAAQPNLADSAPADLLDPVLDLDRDSHDRLDPAARPQWSRQPLAARDRRRRRAAGMAALFRVRRHSRLCPSLHADDDRADLQLDDADRPLADRGRQRCRRQHLAGAVDRHPAAVEDRGSRSARSSSSRW